MFDGGSSYHVQDVGRILLQVQDNLKSLRSSISGGAAAGGAGGPGNGGGGIKEAELAQLDEVLRRAEADLKVKAEVVLNSVVQNSVRMVGGGSLPAVPGAAGGARDAGATAPAGSLSAVHRASSGEGTTRAALKRGGSAKGRSRRRPHSGEGGPGLSVRRERKYHDVTSQGGRDFFRQKYGIPFVSEAEAIETHEPTQRIAGKFPPGGRVLPNKVTKSQQLLPAVNRRDPGAPPPPITEKDVKAGIYSLVNRGMLPGHVDVTQAFTEGQTLVAGRAAVHDWSEQFAPATTYTSPFGFSLSGLKLDFAAKAQPPAPPSHTTTAARSSVAPAGSPSRRAKATTLQFEGSPAPHVPGKAGPGSPDGRSDGEERRRTPTPEEPKAAARKRRTSAGELHSAVDKIRGYNQLLDEYSLHQFIIRRGKVLDTTPEFHSFKRTNASSWGPITLVISALERLCADYNVPTAYVDGQAVGKLASDEIAAARPTHAQLVACIANIDQVAPLLKKPGQMYKGVRGREHAVIKIQATWRMHVVYGDFTGKRRKGAAARLIQHHWRGYAMAKATRLHMREKAEALEEEWRAMQDDFRGRWNGITRKRRVVVHIPSISAEEHSRLNMPRFSTHQNAQMARLCSVADPMVDVVYVAPYQLSDDLHSYYTKLLQIGGVAAPSTRFKIVVPENLSRFPDTMSLAQVLLYSPRALRRIRHYCKGKEAYIVPGILGPEDKRLSMHLKVPLLAPDPAVASLYSTKSGSKRVFAMANVNIAPGAHDIFEQEEFIAALAKLIAANINTPRWLFKIDDEFSGRGHAYLDVATLKVVQTLRREKETRPAGAWSDIDNQRRVREVLVSALQKKLSRRAVICQPILYPTWNAFMRGFCRLGGVIEAAQLEVLGNPSVNMFLSPSGNVSITSTHEQLFGRPYVQMGYRFPSDSVPYEALAGASQAIGVQLSKLGIMGYVGVDFVTFWDAAVGAQRLWAVDLNLRLTPTACSFGLFNFLMRGRLDPKTGDYLVPERREDPAAVAHAGSVASGSTVARSLTGGDSAEARMAGRPPSEAATERSDAFSVTTAGAPEEPRCYTALDYMYHPNLSSLQYAAFFNMCRLQGISFDLQDRVGTAFVLVDALAGGVMGVLCAGRNSRDSASALTRTLEFISSQVGARAPRSEFEEEESNFADILAMMRREGKALAKLRRK